MIKSYSRGYEIYYEGEWLYVDNNKPIDSQRQCKKCGQKPLEYKDDYVDACLGILENVSSACCGHGVEEKIF
jgi:hypothetical protein